MKLPKFLKNIFSKAPNQKGFGLIEILIASAMIVAIAMTVAYFVSDQSKLNMKLEISGSCEAIANSLVEYIKKDEASLFISSYGPEAGSVNFASGLDTTPDGIDRFAFGPLPIPLHKGTGYLNLPQSSSSVPNSWKYYNHLNIKNSTNRLVSLAANGNFCCDGLDMNGNPNCGDRFYDDNVQRPGFTISEKFVEVDLAIDFTNTSCSGRRLAILDVPNSNDPTKVDFKVKVTIRKGTDQEKTCSASGVVQRKVDSDPSLTLIQYENTLCGGSATSPAICGAPAPVRVAVRTYRSNSGTNCQQACQQITSSSNTCSAIGPGGFPDLFDTFDNAACAACVQTDPGSAFLCRIGEKSWMNNVANANLWQPCENAVVHDFDGSVAGSVSIDYTPLVTGNDTTQRTTNAVITLTNLLPERGYVVDVRAVDTSGNIGPSFCSQIAPGNPQNGSLSCSASSPAHFSIITATPQMGSLADSQNFVANAGQSIGAYAPPLSSVSAPKYNSALNAFGSGQFQCSFGGPKFVGTVQYIPPLPAGPSGIPHTCSGTVTAPDGTVTIIPSMGNTATPGCNCVGENCTASLPGVAAQGGYTLRLSAANPCGQLPAIPAQNWCFDSSVGPPLNYTASSNFANSSPNFTNTISPIPAASEPCGVATLCPSGNGTFTPTLGTSCNAQTWNPMSNSGCVQDPSGNFCAVVLDPCGRYKQTNAPPVSYSTQLEGVPHSSLPASNFCFSYGGQQVGGNSCESGSYCSISGKCRTTCAKSGDACTVAADCDDNSYGVTSAQADGPRCIANRCTCPTNSSTPAASDCSQKYCPVFNSCTGNIGSTDGSTACVPPSHWIVGDWSICAAGTRTRTVTCPSAVCIGPQPPTTTTCPDCSSPWGSNVTNGSSITAYQANSVNCPDVCLSETRVCNNGVLSGSYTQQNCSEVACVNSCVTPAPCTDGVQCTLTTGVPTSVDQAWISGAPNCGYNCINGYTGATCQTPPANSCAASAPCTNGTQCSLSTGTPSSPNQAWVNGAANCGYTCINGYTGATCQTPPAACRSSGQPSTTYTCNMAMGQVFATDSSCCDDTSYCSGTEPIGTQATCGTQFIPPTFMTNCSFTEGSRGTVYGVCEWDPSTYWQDYATLYVGDSLDGNGMPVLNTTLYRVQMTSVDYGANCVSYACTMTPGGDYYSRTRVQVFRKSDNVELFNQVIEIDFSMQ